MRDTTVQSRVSRILQRGKAGDAEAYDELVPIVYDELERVAAAYLGRERFDHTLQPGDLVGEVWLRLTVARERGFESRAHFFGVAARAMRQILVDHARRKGARKRTAAGERLTLSEATADDQPDLDVLALDEALAELSELDERKSRILELRFFGSLSNPEIAETLGVSLRTVEGDWYAARAWLRNRLL